MKNRTVTVALCGTAIASLIAGYLWGASTVLNERHPLAASMAPRASDSRQLESLRRENSRLKRELTNFRAASSKTSDQGQVVARLQAAAELKRQRLFYGGLPFFGARGKLDPHFAQLFGLDADEFAALQNAVTTARTKLDELSLANATVTVSGNVATITVRPYNGGADVYDILMNTFDGVLGADRAKAFDELMEDQLNGQFDWFGAEERTLTLTRNPSLNIPGVTTLPYYIRDKTSMMNEGSTVYGGTTMGSWKSLDDAQAYFGPLISLVPPGF